MRRERLTGSFVNGITRPGRYGDGGRGSFGLTLLVRKSKYGDIQKHWQQRYRKNGKFTSRGLGTYPNVSLDQARRNAAHFVATGEHLEERPAPARHSIEASVTFPPSTATVEVSSEHRPPTFRWVFHESLAFRERGFKSAKTATQARGLFASYVPPEIAARSVYDITATDLIGCLAVVWHEKPATAKKLDQHLTAALNHAVATDLIEVSPLVKAKLSLGRLKQNTRNHQRALPHADVGTALNTIEESDAYVATKLAITFLTLTAARSGEVRGARWDEVDFDAETWTVPAQRMKMARPHRVPLSRQAMAVLFEAKEMGDGDGLIFPSVRGKVLSDNTLSKLFREQGIDGTPHGMRSAFRDWAAEESDAPREIAEMCLAHEIGSQTETAYRRSDFLERRRTLMQEWADHVEQP